jgi:hypothetical protein
MENISMVELIILLLACCGLTFTIVHAEIMDILKIRPFLQRFNFTKKLIKCSFCTGFYVGILIGIFYIPMSILVPFALASSAISFLFERFVYLLDEIIIKISKL